MEERSGSLSSPSLEVGGKENSNKPISSPQTSNLKPPTLSFAVRSAVKWDLNRGWKAAPTVINIVGRMKYPG